MISLFPIRIAEDLKEVKQKCVTTLNVSMSIVVYVVIRMQIAKANPAYVGQIVRIVNIVQDAFAKMRI